MYFYRLLVKILLLLLCQNVVNSNNVSTTTINVYFSSYYNSSNGGNGTIVNPFNSDGICNFNNIFTNQDSNNRNNSVVIVNFGTGQYDATNCGTISIIGYSDVTIQSYQDNIQNTETIVEIDGISIGIYSSQITFSNSIGISVSEMDISESSIIYFNVSLVLAFGAHSHVSNSTVTFTESNLSLPIYYIKGPNIIFDQCMVTFSNSTIYNVGIDFSGDVPNLETATGLYIYNGSKVIYSAFTVQQYNFQFDGSVWNDTTLTSFGNSVVTNSIISMTKILNLQSPNVLSNIFTVLYISTFQCKNTTIQYYSTQTSSILQIGTGVGIVGFTNVTISNYNNITPMFLLVDTNSTFVAIDLKIENCVSSSLFEDESAHIVIVNLTLIGNTFYSLIRVYYSLQFRIESTSIQCDQNNNIDQVITMNELDIYGKSSIVFSNYHSNCVGIYSFRNSSVIFENVEINTLINQDLITLFDNSDLFVINCKFVINSLNVNSFLITTSDSSSFITLVSSSFVNSSGSILSTFSSESVIITNCTFQNVISKYYPVIQFFGSDVQISNSKFIGSGPNLIVSDNSTILITNSCFENIGSSIITSSLTSTISIVDSLVLNCFPVSALFSFSNGPAVEIINTKFTGNHGYDSQLFQFNQYDNVTISQCTFIGNSFSPMILSKESNVFIELNHIVNLSGSFYQSVADFQCIINQFNYDQFNNNQNNAPIQYLFYFINSTLINFSNVNITNNYLMDYLFIASGIQTIEISKMSIKNNTIVSAGLEISTTWIEGNGYHVGLFVFSHCEMVKLDEVTILDNDISLSLFYIDNSVVVVEGSTFDCNQVFSSASLFYSSENGDLTIANSNIKNNLGTGLTLIHSIQSNLTIDNCNATNNQFIQNGEGSIAYYISDFTFLYFGIINSIFIGNNARSGGVFLVESYSSPSNTPFVTLVNNTFISNSAIEQGGVICTNIFAISNNMTDVYNTNTFINNTSLYGIDFSSSFVDNGKFKSRVIHLENNVESFIRYSLFDYYGNIYTPFSDELVFNITRVSTGQTEVSSFRANAGKGQFYYTFIGNENDEYIIECTYPVIFTMTVIVDKCLPFQMFDSTTGTCSYCQIGYSTINSSSSCVECNDEHVTCLGNSVSTLNNYYMIDQNISNVKQCTLDTCNSGNICTNELGTGLLCFDCLDPDENGIADGSNGIITSKNGIQCCKYFNSFILISILVIVFIVFGLSLSWFKYNGYKSSFNSIILFIQINSIVFFSYNGIYILPLFRLSIDMIDGYCLFKSLNFNHKSILSFLIIISLFLIGSTDITLYLLKKLFGERIDIDQLTKPLLKDGYSNIKYPMFIQKAINIKEKSNRILSKWSLIQLFIIPLIFNSILSVVTKNINNTKYLSIDFSIEYNSQFNLSIVSISLVSIAIVSILLLFIIFISFVNFKTNSFLNKCQKFLVNLNYKESYKWWDIIIIIRSVIYCTLSVTMLFSCQLYLTIIISIQLVYSISYFLLNPLKSIKHQLKDINNPINLLQLINFIILDSTLLHLSTPYEKGLTISILTFVSIIIILCYKHFYLNIKPKTIKPPKPINKSIN